MLVHREPGSSQVCHPGHTQSPMDEGVGLWNAVLRVASGPGCLSPKLPPQGGSSDPTLQDVHLATARAVPEG